MPASHERVPNKPLSGTELMKIMENDVANTLRRDGMFSQNLAYGRVSYEIRISMHLDNYMYPEHVSVTLSKKASKQQIEANPELEALLAPPIEDETEQAIIVSQEVQAQILSPNVARIENDLPLTIAKRDMDTGHMIEVKQTYKGDMPDPSEVGNLKKVVDTSADQTKKWRKK